jgi:hypothetical protein
MDGAIEINDRSKLILVIAICMTIIAGGIYISLSTDFVGDKASRQNYSDVSESSEYDEAGETSEASEDGVSNKDAESSEETSSDDEVSNSQSVDKLVIFHNGSGPMCVEAVEFFEAEGIEYTEYLTTDENFTDKLNEYRQRYEGSRGVSSSFGYYPIIFVGDSAFSGFNDEVKKGIIDTVDRS